MDKRLNGFSLAVAAMADEFDFDIECAMIAVKDSVSGKCTVVQLGGRSNSKRRKKKKK